MASPPFNPDQSIPGDTDIISQYPALERLFRDILESWLLFEHTTAGRHKFPVDTDANLAGLSGVSTGTFLWSTSSNTLQFHNGSGMQIVNLPSGTRALFQQTAAPVGWTKDTGAGLSNTAIRLVTGAVSFGGTQAFTDCFSAFRTPTGAVTVNGHTLTEGEIPAHRHFVSEGTVAGGFLDGTHGILRAADLAGNFSYDLRNAANEPNLGRSSSAGGGGSHSHTASFSGNTMPMDVIFHDVILAQKDG